LCTSFYRDRKLSVSLCVFRAPLHKFEENSKQTMDSIYTTNKEYTDGTTLVEVKLYI
jgi:hypothetical protein